MSKSTPIETFPSHETLGREWIVEARGCEAQALRDLPTLRGLFRRIIEELGLNEVQPSTWHVFPGSGGITGMSLLAESHLTCHSSPEHGTICLNLFCCRPRPRWDFEGGLAEELGAEEVHVRTLARRYVPSAAEVTTP
ncbi:MAG: S-adenosylmethionine decarboxylase [Gemmatimonadetes bacterium]|nr:S-adenosylmethionine decarboxylase [Gemmatimonadota bacterium]